VSQQPTPPPGWRRLGHPPRDGQACELVTSRGAVVRGVNYQAGDAFDGPAWMVPAGTPFAEVVGWRPARPPR
jgi:hypothetical protein